MKYNMLNLSKTMLRQSTLKCITLFLPRHFALPSFPRPLFLLSHLLLPHFCDIFSLPVLLGKHSYCQ